MPEAPPRSHSSFCVGGGGAQTEFLVFTMYFWQSSRLCLFKMGVQVCITNPGSTHSSLPLWLEARRLSGLTEPLRITLARFLIPSPPHVSIATGNAPVTSCPSACLSDCGRDLSISVTLTTVQRLVLSRTDFLDACTDDGRPGAHGHWKWTLRSRHSKTIYWLMVSLLVGTSCSPSPPLLKRWKSP